MSSLFPFDGLLQTQFASRRDDRQVVVAVVADQVADAFEYVIFSPYLLKINIHGSDISLSVFSKANQMQMMLLLISLRIKYEALMLTVPSGSTSSRCLARPLCMPVSTYEPGLVVLLRTRKSPSLRRSFSALWRLISPWYQLCCSSSGRERRAERVSTGLQLSTDDALFNTDTEDDGD